MPIRDGSFVKLAEDIQASTLLIKDVETANLFVTTEANLGPVANVTITGGANGQSLLTDGAGNVSFGVPGHANTANTVTDAAQPNITSVGNLSSLTVAGNAVVGGNLTVGGNISYTNITQLVVEDPIIELGTGANGNALTTNDGKDRGTLLRTFSTAANAEVNKFMGWDASGAEFIMASNAAVSNGVVTINQFGNVHADHFIGNGSQLTDITGANVTGTVANATHATSANTANTANTATTATSANTANTANSATVAASANSVAGANVSGTVANATFATSAGSANTATVAASANSVAGANVTGTVANATYATSAGSANTANTANLATYATTANSVAGANVSGTVANATFATSAGTANTANLATYATTANSVAGANVSGTVANANYAAYAGNVTIAAQANITTVGTLGNLTVANANVTNSLTVADFRATGNTTLGNIPSGSQYTPAPLNLTKSLGGGLKTQLNLVNEGGGSGAGSAIDFYTYTGQGNGVPGARISSVDDANYSANVSIWTKTTGNVGNGTLVEAIRVTNARNLIVYGNATANFFIGSGNNLSNIQAANITGTVANATFATTAGTAGTVTTASQPNITSVGTLANLTSNGTINLIGASNVSLGAVGNVKITGGSNGQVLTTNGNGTLSWGNASSGSGNANNIVSGTSNVNIATANGNVTIGVAGNAAIATFTGTGANIGGTLQVGGVSNLGPVGNVIVTGGANGQILTTNGSGALSWSDASGLGVGLTGYAHLTTSSSISLSTNTVVPFTVAQGTLTGASNGVTLKAGKTYRLTAAIGVTGGWFNFFMWSTASGNFGVSSFQSPKSSAESTNYTVQSVVSAVYTPTVDTAVFVKCTATGGGSASLNPGVTWAYAEEIGSSTLTGNISVGAGATATSSSTGALVVNGGVGISGNAYVGTNLNVTGTTNVGAVGNLVITGGSNGQVLTTNGNGTLSWANGGGSGNANNIVSGTSNVNIASANGNVTIGVAGNAAVATFTGTGANISGNLTVTGKTNVGAVGNLVVTGGTSGQVLTTDGSGVLSWSAASALGAVEYVAAYRSNTSQTGITANTDIVMNNKQTGSGNLGSTYNTTTGVFTLTAGVTYKLEAQLSIWNFSNSTNGYMVIQWVDAATNIPLAGTQEEGALIATPATVTGPNADPLTTGIIYTAPTNMTVKLRITGASGTAEFRGAASYASICQIGSSSFTGNISIGGGAAANSSSTGAVVVNGGLGVSGNAYVGTNLNVTGTTNVGAVGNLVITGGSNGQALITNGNGVLTWGNVATGDAANAANANYANFAGTAYSVSAANITGTVANATFATSAGSANTANLATYATTANAVAGANVSGTVANATFATSAESANTANTANLATYATTANAVAGANVSGTVANATFATSAESANTANTANLATYATTANAVAGANVSGTVANATFATSAGSANTAATVTTNAQPNITSVGTLANLTANGTINLADASNVSLGAVANLHISGGSNGQALTTDSNGNLSWNSVSTKYTREWHVSATNGNDTTGVGSYDRPYATINAALAMMSNLGEVLYLHPGTYSENVTWSILNSDIVGVHDSGLINLTGAWTFSGASSSVRVHNLYFAGTLTHSGAGALYISELNIVGTAFSKTGSGYLELYRVNAEPSSFSVTGTGQTVIVSGTQANLVVNNAAAVVNIQSSMNCKNTTVTAGTFSAVDSWLFSSTAGTAALTASASAFTYVGLNDCRIYGPTGTIERISLPTGTIYSMASVVFDRANSTLTGTNSPTIAYSDAITTLGNLTVGGVTSLGAVGNVKITGGSNAQFLQTNGSGNLAWASIPTAANIANGTSNVRIAAANGNVTVAVAGNSVVTFTGTGTNVTGTANITGNVTVGNLNGANAVTANFFIGSGANLTNIAGANVSGTVANATYATSAGSATSATTAGSVTTAAQGNITSVGTLSGLTMGGNIVPSVGNTYNLGSPTAKWANIYVGPNSLFIQDSANSAVNAELQVTNGVLYINGAQGVSANIVNGTSNVLVASSGNISFSSAGTSNVVTISNVAATVNGNLTVTGRVSANSAYGMFWNSANIANPGANTAAAITWNAQDGINGMSYSGANITIARAGKYNVQFNAQVTHPGGGQASNVYFWMNVDGTDVPGSGGVSSVQAGVGVIQSWNALVTANANSVAQMRWASNATDIKLTAYANAAWHPAIPSALITITPVGA